MLKRKILSITLAVLMLLSLLSGCRSAEVYPSTPIHTSSIPTTAKPTTVPTTAPQSTWHNPLTVPPGVTERNISSFYNLAEIRQTKDTQLCFFGAFDGTYAVLVRDKANPGEPCWETVNGLTFYYPDGYAIMWGDGRLWYKFTQQEITEEQLQEIYDNYYSAYPELLYLANGQLEFGPTEMDAFRRALLQLTGKDVSWDAVNSIGRRRLVYYGTVMGAHIVRWIPTRHSGYMPIKYIDVGPYSFGHTEFMWIFVYVNDEIITLTEAYERGFFGDMQLEVIYRLHTTTPL